MPKIAKEKHSFPFASLGSFYSFVSFILYSLSMKIVAKNRRARFDYEILDTVEAGIVLTGPEVKSCRAGQINLAGAYVSFLSGVPMVKGMKISPYAYASNGASYSSGHDRLLLLKKNEIVKIENAAHEKGMTIVPLEVHAGKFIKVLLGLGKGRKRLDKRQRIKEREISRRVRETGGY